MRLAWLALAWLATARAQLTNLALGRVPFGSAESYAQGFEKVTDGDLTSQWSSHARPPVTTRPAWRIPEPAFVQAPPVASVATWRLPDFKEMLGDYPGVLLVDLGAPSQIDHMRLYSAVEAGGFETLKVYRSVEGLSWPLVRAESNRFHCSPGVMSHHHGWPEETRYVLLEMQDRCSGVHRPGRFAVAEWEIWGAPRVEMVPFLWRSWPKCMDLQPCFAYSELEQTKRSCLADDACDGFSFSSERMKGGSGSGCFKTRCRGYEEVNGTERLALPPVPLGRGSFGYWAKRRWPWPFIGA